MNKINLKPTNEEPKAPDDFKKALSSAPKVKAAWKGLTPLARWDFIIWINQTKNPATRKHRIKVALSKLAAGQRRPCCFTIVPAELYKAFKANPKAKAGWNILDATARRNLVTWIDSAKLSADSKTRSQKACLLLASGKLRS